MARRAQRDKPKTEAPLVTPEGSIFTVNGKPARVAMVEGVGPRIVHVPLNAAGDPKPPKSKNCVHARPLRALNNSTGYPPGDPRNLDLCRLCAFEVPHRRKTN